MASKQCHNEVKQNYWVLQLFHFFRISSFPRYFGLQFPLLLFSAVVVVVVFVAFVWVIKINWVNSLWELFSIFCEAPKIHCDINFIKICDINSLNYKWVWMNGRDCWVVENILNNDHLLNDCSKKNLIAHKSRNF